MARNFPHLGFDPAPGDVEQTRGLARQIGNLSADLNTTVIELAEIDVADWKGKAAIAFRGHVEHDIQPLIVKAYSSFDRASSALNSWANSLQEFQHEADGLEREAAQHQADLDHAKAALNTPPPANGTPNPAPSGTDHQDKQKHQAVTDAGSALDGVRRRAHDLHDRYTRTAKAIASQLDKAGHIAPEKPGLFHDIVSGVEGAWDATADWVKDHANLIKAIGDILGDLSAVLGTLAIICIPFEPLGAIFGGLALAASGMALVTHLVAKAGGANVSWMSIGTDALGVLPGLGMLSKGVKVADAAVAAERAAEFGKGFEASVVEARKIFAFGKATEGLEGGKQFAVFGKQVALFGKGEFGLISKGSGMADRLASLSDKTYHAGQMLGTKGLRLASFGKLSVSSLNPIANSIEAQLKLAPHLAKIPQHIGEAIHPGDRFQQAATA